MKRLLPLLLSALLTLTACASGTESCPAGDSVPATETTETFVGEPVKSSWAVNDHITISLPQSVYPVGTENFTVTLENRGDETMLYGESYSFQYHDGSGWTDPATIENYAFNAIGYLLTPGSTQTLEVGPWMLQEPLQEGLYRIVGCTLRVAGSEDQLGYGGDYTEYAPYELEFRISAEADVHTVILPEDSGDANAPFRLEIRQPEPGAQRLEFSFLNESGADAEVLLIPTLEYINEFGNWEIVLFREDVGFCGTPDPLPVGRKDWAEDLPLLWGQLPDGEYRLSFTVTDNDGTEHTACGQFTYEDGLCGLPTADTAS